jgi:hypothetical protein
MRILSAGNVCSRSVLASLASFLAPFSVLGQLPVGTLAHDGPATPEQIALVLPVTGSLPTTATATTRYRAAGSSTWIVGHPLFRIRPSFADSPAVGSVADAFAWTIIDLTPGTNYEVEVTISSGGTTQVQTASFTTRSLPPSAGQANKTISAGATGSAIQTAFNGLVAGDVLEIENGSYSVNNLVINRSGNAGNPIYIRGESRAGVVLRDSTGPIIEFLSGSHVVLENLTLQGAGTDGGLGSQHVGISGGSSAAGTTRNTIRNVNILGVDRGIRFFDEVTEALIYDNTIRGNNVWSSAYLSDNRTWDDDGMNVPGFGNVVFNNTMSGFGDNFSYAQHSGGSALTETRGVHYYRNDVRNSLDDLIEVDHAQRNVSFYDNRSHNSANCGSLDPLYGGPFLYARNICINPARTVLHKWNSTNTGQFYYSNTFISTVNTSGTPDAAMWYQPNNGAQRAYGYRNNLHVYRGNGLMLWLESTSHDPIDWTHNSWFPDRGLQWGGVYQSLASAQSGLSNTTPIFSGTNRRMQNDNITVSNPWTTTVTLGANSFTEVTATYTPELAAGTTPKNSGAVLPNITDGFSGAAPDRGALIAGRGVTVWGDRGPPGPSPNPPSNLTAE